MADPPKTLWRLPWGVFTESYATEPTATIDISMRPATYLLGSRIGRTGCPPTYSPSSVFLVERLVLLGFSSAVLSSSAAVVVERRVLLGFSSAVASAALVRLPLRGAVSSTGVASVVTAWAAVASWSCARAVRRERLGALAATCSSGVSTSRGVVRCLACNGIVPANSADLR